MNETTEAQTGSVLYGLYLDILTGITSGDYPPKSTLPTESRLVRDYGVSRSVVRSALEMLKKRGIVRSQQGSGTVVACSDPQKLVLPDFEEHLPGLRDCYACRLAIEPEIAAQLALHQTTPATAFLAAQLDVLECHPHDGAETGNLGTASDADFHVRLAEFSDNKFFSSIMTALRPHMLFSMNIKKYLTGSAQKTHENLSRLEHRKIVWAILGRDACSARELMREHLTNGRERVFQARPGKARVADAQFS